MVDSPLVGRAAEQRALADALTRARRGHGGLVLIDGEPGIGKSALASAFVASIAPDDCTIVRGRAWEAEAAPAYFPVWPCLRMLGLQPATVTQSSTEFAIIDFGLWERVLAELARVVRERPAIWLIEDVHAADAQSLDLLLFLAGPLRTISALVIATTRTSDPRIEGAVAERLLKLRREAEIVALTALAESDASALARRHGPELDGQRVQEIVAACSGNPLYLVELARAGRIASSRRGASVLPATLVSSVADRAARLPATTRALLDDAAVLGMEVSAATLARMVDRLPARVIDDLAPALRAGLLHEVAPGHFEFTHALVRDAILQTTTASARHDAHARAEAALAPLGDSPDVLVERAGHALASLTPQRVDDTVQSIERAIAMLCRQGAFDRARALHGRMLAARRAGELPAVTPTELLRGAALARDAGSFSERRVLALEAAALARARGDVEGLAHAALMLGAELRPGEVDPTLVVHLEEAVTLLGAEHRALECRVAARLAAAQQPAADPHRPVAMARAAIQRARELADDDVLCETLLWAGAAMTGFCDESETCPLAVELLELATRRGDTVTVLRALTRLAHDEGTLGHADAHAAALDRLLQMARGIGHPRLVWRPLLMASVDALEHGAFAESERMFAQVRALARLTDDPALALSLLAFQHSFAIATDREELALEGMQNLARDDIDVPSRTMITALMGAVVGARFGDTELVARSLAQYPFESIAETYTGAMLLCFAEGYAVAGTAEQCRVLHARASAHPDREVYFGHVAMSYEGPVARILGLLERRYGDHAAAERSLRAALDRCRAHARLPWVARIAFELAELLRETGRTEDSALFAREATAIAASLGMNALAARAARLDAHVAQTRVDPPAIAATSRALSMRQVGDAWEVRWGDRTLHVPDRRGLALLARLIERPCEEIHVLVLAADGGTPTPESSAGEAIDSEAVANYRERLREIDDERERDPSPSRERIAAWDRESDFLHAELGRAVGLGGALRQIGSSSERARVNVQRRLKDAITRIERADAELGRYLRAGVRTGSYCTFRP